MAAAPTPPRDRWIVIPDWDKHQHYKHRKGDAWHKEHARQLDNDDYLGLSLAARGVLIGLRMMYARRHPKPLSENQARATLAPTRHQVRTFSAHIESLNHAGFITLLASKPLAQTETESLKTLNYKSLKTETETVGSASGLSINRTPENPLIERLLREIRDADTRTAAALYTLEQRLPEAAFAAALESLQHRRTRNGRRLVSEARYVVAALTTMEREGTYH